MSGLPVKPLPSAGVLREFFRYDPDTGELFRVFKGGRLKRTGSKTDSGHLAVRFLTERYYVHRVIWKIVTGEEPPELMDHKDTNGENNKWENLRAASSHANSWNRPARSDNTSGRKGVTWHKRGKKWLAQIQRHGNHYYLGLFHTVEDAARAYDAACAKLHGEFANTGGKRA